ncbi:MAG: hypothetical protein LQ348_000063 [Seirophora lacunosa]|nr:MAG: hypothetical protein LQ344_000538 [Seirophora lacunosa]KAI4208742.1 MAG: hypothetical protein LQ348_000063 [Seirophora lacunosa]
MSDRQDLIDRPSVSETRLEKALRDAVEETFKADPEQLTVKRLRSKVEKDLGLDDGFFKSDAAWNARSKEAAQEAQSQPQSSQVALSPSPAKKPKQLDKGNKTANGKKRRATSSGAQSKRRRKSEPDEELVSKNEDTSPLETATRTGDRPTASSSPPSDFDQSEENAAKVANHVTDRQGSDSEMSVLIDEDPKPKKRAPKANSEKPSSKRKEGSKPAKVPQQPTDLDSEEIKRLQGWLVKCGIRKMWYKELAPYDTSKAKIRHLKGMLTGAGMTGRYSQEKATQIREERELKADIEAVQAGAKQWGRVEPDEEDGGRLRRKVAKGLQELDFLKDDDGEDSD